jgi:hypothetical protein
MQMNCSNKKYVRLFFIAVFSFALFNLHAQQNHTLYFVPENPQVNTLNPAFQNSCKLFIGLPVISSIHFNLGHDGFTYRELFKNAEINPNNINLGKVNSLNSELYVNLLTVGVWQKKNYITFAVTEKNDLAGFYHRDLFNVVLGGNRAYEGKTASFSRTGIFYDYRREYALGVARKINPETTLGMKGKLLFGKLNISTRKSNNELFTDEETFNLNANADLTINTSMPVSFTRRPDGRVNGVDYNGTPTGILFNRKNVGLAFDLGFIHKLSDKETLSGSILDLGAIRYTSNSNSLAVKGEYTYVGQLADTIGISSYFDRAADQALGQLSSTVTQGNYTAFLPPRVYLSYEYAYSPKTTLNALTSAKIYRYKILPGFTLGATHEILKNIHFALSWSYVQRSVKNLGTGLVIGHSPVQFYAFSDNIFGFIDPLSAKNINLRFGINLIFGCVKKENIKKHGCEWLQNAETKNERLRKLRKK